MTVYFRLVQTGLGYAMLC